MHFFIPYLNSDGKKVQDCNTCWCIISLHCKKFINCPCTSKYITQKACHYHWPNNHITTSSASSPQGNLSEMGCGQQLHIHVACKHQTPPRWRSSSMSWSHIIWWWLKSATFPQQSSSASRYNCTMVRVCFLQCCCWVAHCNRPGEHWILQLAF